MSSGKFLFYLFMMLGPILAVSSSSWLICWVGVELSFLGLIPLMIGDKKMSPSLSSESTMKYFCIQAMGSGLLMCGGIMKFLMPEMSGILSNLVFLIGLCLKLGIFPLHFWVPSVVSGLEWYSMFLILTWQKIAPFFLLMNLAQSSSLLSEIIIILGGSSAIIGAIIGLNQTSVSPMLGASSITHSGWAILGAMNGAFWVYFGIYCFSLMLLMLFLEKNESLMSGMMLLSISGLPPFFMFTAKWSVMKSALSLGGEWWYLFLPVLGSILSLFFYLKFFYCFYMEASFYATTKATVFCSVSALSFLGALYVVSF